MPPDNSDGLPPRRRRIAFVSLLIGIFALVMDGVALTVALPTMAQAFGIGPSASTWAVNLYQVAIIAVMLPAAALGQIVGYRSVYIGGLLLFAAMAIVSATASSFEILVLARGLQGVGTALALSVNLAILRHIVPAGSLGRSIGLNATVVALAATSGPLFSGLILSVASWHWVLASFIPVALLAMLGAVSTFPDTQRAQGRFDGLSALFSALTFGSLLLALSGTGHGWPASASLVLLAIGLLSAVALVRRARREAEPLLPIDLLRIRAFRLSAMASICAFSVQMLMFVTLPFHLQHTLALTALEAGMLFSLWPLALALCAPFAGSAADRMSSATLCMAGLSALALGLAILGLAGSSFGLWPIGLGLALGGFGFGLFQTPNNRTMISSAPRVRSSAASGTLGTARLLGQALGTALATLTLAIGVQGGWQVATMLGAALAVAGAVISRTRGREA